MAEPFLAEIRLMSFNFAPKGWALCDGQFLPINQNQALFSLLGTTYGGNGQTTFALPDLRGRVPMGWDGGHRHHLGDFGGAAAHTLSVGELPTHTHALNASAGDATAASPANARLAAVDNGFREGGELTTLHPGSVTAVGGSQAHPNMQPYLALNYCIALQGIFPSPN